ncbi:raffinose invertase-like [Vanessa cardui]|uniref:raffinose invertase-like n=1 Tax=Vanessa cardui TaxID=171605 RepID=UPI001F145C37|nr:raffinose invertase-like [Vanessa cardui]
MDIHIFIVILWVLILSGDFSDLGHVNSLLNRDKRFLKKKYRPIYHITAPEGWISSPTGFAYYKRQYHIFFQYYPYNGAWDHVSWGHAISDNLIDWIHFPTALMPKDQYDRHGCLAGCALVHNNLLTLFYTGNVISGYESLQTQNVAISSDGMFFEKYLFNPIIRESPSEIGEFRNPKVWRFRKVWYMIVGTTSRERNGQLVLYTSRDMFNWDLNGTLVNSYGDMGNMWENPDLFELDGYHVLIISVQGADSWRFRNVYQTGYILGHFNYVKSQFDDMEVSIATFNQLDYGHDFYTVKTMRAKDGRRLLIGWLGMWESEFIESSFGWASMLTIVRELRINKNGRIRMKPIEEIIQLREELIENAWYKPGEFYQAESQSFELLVNSTSVFSDVKLIFEWKFGQFVIEYSADNGYISIDRGGNDGVRRAYWSPVDYVYIRIFVDSSSIEVFCGDGDVVFSSRIYPNKIRVRIAGYSKVHIMQYKLRRSVGSDKKRRHRVNNNLINSYIY